MGCSSPEGSWLERNPTDKAQISEVICFVAVLISVVYFAPQIEAKALFSVVLKVFLV